MDETLLCKYILDNPEENKAMEIKIHSIDFKVKGSLKDLIQKKVEKLEKLNGAIQNCDVYLKDDPLDSIVEIKLSIPHNTLFCTGHGDSFESALADSAEKMRRQLEKKHA